MRILTLLVLSVVLLLAQSTPSLLAPTSAVDFSGAITTKSTKSGTAPPGTCTVAEMFFDTDATAGQNVSGCTSTNVWTLLGDGGGGAGVANYETTFTTQTSVTVTGATHGFGHRKIFVACYNDASPRALIGHSHTVDSSTFDVVITFAVNQTGLCILNGWGGPAITSLASQTGATQTITRGVGIAGSSATNDHSFTLDLAELVANQTIFDSASASRTITFGLSGATDPVLTVGDNVFNISTGVLQQGGTAVVLTSRSITGGVGIVAMGDLSADRTVTFDATELTALTWSAGGSGSIVWDFNLTAGDPQITFGNGVVNVTSGTLQQGGTGVVLTSRTLTGGAGIGALGDLSTDRTIATASGEADFLTSGALTCGASTQGKMQVHTTPLQYCDNAGTPVLQYAAYGNSTGESTAAANNSVALGTDTVNDYIASLSNGIGLTGFPAAGETATGTVAFDFSQTLAGDPAYNAKECVFTTTGTSGGGFICEGSTGANANEQLYLFPALDGADTTKFIAIADSSPATVGQLLRVTGTGLAEWGALDLADGDAITGVLPDANVATTLTRDTEWPSASATLTEKTLDCEGTNNNCGVTSKIFIDFASCVGGAAFNSWDDDGGGGTEPTAACNDTGAIQRPSSDFSGSAVTLVQRTIKLPSDWASGGATDIVIRYVTVAASPTGNIEFDISTVCRAVAESWDGAFNAAQTITDAAGAQNALNDATQASVTMTGCAAGEDLTIQVSRDGTNDTNNDLAKALYLELTYRRTI